MKPHRSIFEAALEQAGCRRGGVMVGDSLKPDIEGALAAGMRAVLLRRSGEVPPALPAGVQVIRTLAELPDLLSYRHEDHEAYLAKFLRVLRDFVRI